MAWNLFTAADVLGDLSDAETQAITNFHGGKDKLPGIVDDMLAAVRGAIAQRQAVGEAGTIPDSLRHFVSHMAIEHFLLTIPSALLTEPRKAAADEARKVLEQVRKGEWRVELPETVSGDQFSRPQIKTAQSQTRVADRDHLKGL